MIHPSNNSIGAIWHWFNTELHGQYSDREARAMANEVFSHLLSISPAERVLQSQRLVSESLIHALQKALDSLLKHIPLQYVTGNTQFLDLQLQVDQRVLIPRNETEELVLWVLESLGSSGPSSILDVGAGSGCISISLAKARPCDQVIACDLFPEILELIEINALKNDVTLQLRQIDILQDEQEFPPLDVVVSNPPYVRELEKPLMEKNVLVYEPAHALFVKDEDPLIFYREISKKAYKWLKPGGLLFFEINETLGKETLQTIAAEGFSELVLRQDIHGKDRFVRGVKV